MKNKAKAWAGVPGDSTPSRQAQLEETVARLANAYEVGRYELPPEELVRQLREYASGADVDYIVSLLGWEGANLFTADLTRERDYAISQSRHAWRHSPLYQWSVWIWTAQATGESINVVPVEEGARDVWSEFWEADRNAAILGQDKIHELSEWILVDGDCYLVYFADTSDGEVTLDSISPDEFPEPPITDPKTGRPLFYKRVWMSKGVQETLYYPDWVAFFNYPEKLDQMGLLPPGAKRSDQVAGSTVIIDGEGRGTVAVMQHIAHNRKNKKDLRGWPLGTVSGRFQRAHERFMEGRMAVSIAKQMYVQRMEVPAGSRGLASIKDTLQASTAQSGWGDTNPSAAPGSTQLTNKGITTTDLPMTTGAGDAEADNKIFSWAALIGDGVFTTTAGLDANRYATALTMDKNQAMLWSRYKSFISQQFKNMVRIILSFKEKYSDDVYGDKNASVVIDTLSIVDFPPVVTAMSEMFDRALTPLVNINVIPLRTAKRIAAATWAILLQSLGVEAIDELVNEETFGVDDEEEPPAVEPPSAPVPAPEDVTGEEPAFERALIEQQARAIAQRDVALERALVAIETAAERMGDV